MQFYTSNQEAERMAYHIAGWLHAPVEPVLAAIQDYARTMEAEWLRSPIPDKQEKREDIYNKIMAIAEDCSKLPVYDNRSPEEIVGYDEYGSFPHGD